MIDISELELDQLIEQLRQYRGELLASIAEQVNNALTILESSDLGGLDL